MSRAQSLEERMHQRKPTFSRSRTRGIHLIPNTVSCEGTTTVALIFDEIPDLRGTGKVEVSVRSVHETVPVVATPINQQSFRFVAPENRAGEVPVMVFVGGVEVASTHLNYTQEGVHLATGLTQLHLQLLTKTCRYIRVLQRTPVPVSELDQSLSEWFEDKEDANKIQPKVFEELFDILRHSSSDIIRSPHEFPTLLHFTAEFGLTKLAERLMDLPGAERASQVRNAEGLTASMIALENKCDSLCAILNRKRVTNAETNTSVARPSQTDDNTEEEQYLKPDSFDDNRDIVVSPKSSTTKTLPPTPVTKPAQQLGSGAYLDRLPPAPTPRRESRDSGFDASEVSPSPSARQRRQAFARAISEQTSTPDQSTRPQLETSSSQDSSSRPTKLSERDVRLQLSRPVLTNSGSRGTPFAR